MEGLDKKIDELFSYRLLPYLIELGGASPEDGKKLYGKLTNLQKAIYFLDHYLETNWVCTQGGLEIHWKSIRASLEKDFNLNEGSVTEYIKHIQKYQKHELELRRGLLPTRLDMEYFYFYKSCDVKLMRRLIYDNYPSLHKNYPLADWRCFDLITEVNDDVEDIFEDIETINGNRFLILTEGEGIKKAAQRFENFIDEIDSKNEDRLAKKGREYSKIFQMTKDMITDTKILLKNNTNIYSTQYQKSTSKLHNFLSEAVT